MAAPRLCREGMSYVTMQSMCISQVLTPRSICRRHLKAVNSCIQPLRPMSVFSYWKEKYSEKQELFLKAKNVLSEKRVDYWGTELAAAHWLLYHNAAIQFTNGEWYMKNRKGRYYLPRQRVKGEYIRAVDAKATQITYEGLDNIICLKHLKFLSLERSPYIDDFCLAKLYHFRDSLTHLNIKGCPQISERGLATLHHLRKLEKLNMRDLPKVDNIQLVAVMLEDVLLNLKLDVISAHVDMHAGHREKDGTTDARTEDVDRENTQSLR